MKSELSNLSYSGKSSYSITATALKSYLVKKEKKLEKKITIIMVNIDKETHPPNYVL